MCRTRRALHRALAGLARLDPATLPLVQGDPRLGPPVAGTGKFICIGLNYADHAAESGMQVPPEPVIFMKATSAICGPNDPIIIPRGSEKTDWEVELAVIIGQPAKYVDEADAMSHVAGFAVTNDVSERAFQTERAGQWTKGKSCDNFGQIGPWLVTPDEIADPQDLAMCLSVIGQTMQDAIDGDDGLSGAVPDPLPQPVHDAASGRRDFHRNASGRRDGDAAATLPAGGRRRRAGHQGLGQQRQEVIADPA